ncbi:MAG: hypothetical protein ABL907_23585 [Hyphomicrobium sp.]
MSLKFISKISIATVLAGSLAGCSADDVQLNGKVFDAMGMNTASVKSAPKVGQRAGLVVPPNLSSLPEPGSGGEQPAIAEIKDYDATRTTAQADLEKQQAEYCKKNYDDAKVFGDQDAVLATGPLGPCQKSAFSAVKSMTEGGSSE